MPSQCMSTCWLLSTDAHNDGAGANGGGGCTTQLRAGREQLRERAARQQLLRVVTLFTDRVGTKANTPGTQAGGVRQSH